MKPGRVRKREGREGWVGKEETFQNKVYYYYFVLIVSFSTF